MPKLPVLEPVPTAQVCCAPLTSSPLSAEDAVAAVDAAQGACGPDPASTGVAWCCPARTASCCTCDVIEPLGLSQPTISHHFKKLTEAGLVTGERRGTWTYYRIVPEALAALAAVISPDTSTASC